MPMEMPAKLQTARAAVRAFVPVTACALAFIMATLSIVTGTAAPEPDSGASRPQSDQLQTYEGVITDTRCGAKHSPTIGKMAPDCTLTCVLGGEQFALVDGDDTYLLKGDPVTLKRGAGRRVRLVGTPNGRTILVRAVVP